jgi:hypothetical protein
MKSTLGYTREVRVKLHCQCATEMGLNPGHVPGSHTCESPSLTSSTPPMTAALKAGLRPARSCRKPPVRAPAMMALNGSSCVQGRVCFVERRVWGCGGVGGGIVCRV